MSLRTYRAKRDFRKTPEPAGKKKSSAKGLAFVVQKHDATRLHYDFRLELDGVLLSWAVPKGPSLDPGEKRLAVQVEDHPFDYRSFEGIIPPGQYGSGTVIVWDRGTWEALEDPHKGLAKGHLKFTLHGEKLSGAWNLVRLPSRGRASEKPNWLLMKSRDAAARVKGDILEERPESVKSARTLKEVAEGKRTSRKRVQGATAKGRVKNAASVKAKGRAATKPAKKKSPRRKRPVMRASQRRTRAGGAADWTELPGVKAARMPGKVESQLATLVEKPPEGEAWIHEVKYDGYRMWCRLKNGRAQFISRNGRDWTTQVRPLDAAAAGLPADEAILDGELVVLDAQGLSHFQDLQAALGNGGRREALRFVAFDLIHLDGYSLTNAALVDRKTVLKGLLDNQSDQPTAILYSEHVVGSGGEAHARACADGLEGIVSKRADAPYQPGRGCDWLKSKCRNVQEFVIGGFTRPKGGRKSFGAVLVGHFERDKFIYAWRVGTGFGEKTLAELEKQMRAIEQKTSPFVSLPAQAVMSDVRWVKPELVAQVEFANWTSDGLLRQAAFQGLRADKAAGKVKRERASSSRSCAMPTKTTARKGRAKSKAAAQEIDGLPEGFRLTNAERVIFEEPKLTKGDLVAYYARVAERMLPYVAERPLSLMRCPEGTRGKCFFQKHPPVGLPEVVERIPIQEKDEVDTYLFVRDVEGLLALIQFGAVEIHTWGAKVDDVEKPDQLVFDLDPGPQVPWKRVVGAALGLRELLGELDLESFVKTTGGKGLHVCIPIARRWGWDEVKPFCKALAERVTATAPEHFIAKSTKSARVGKIFIDYLRNDRGATFVSPYSCRARAGAAVAMPVSWEELARLKSAAEFTVENASARLERKDPWARYLKVRQSLKKSAMGRVMGK